LSKLKNAPISVLSLTENTLKFHTSQKRTIDVKGDVLIGKIIIKKFPQTKTNGLWEFFILDYLNMPLISSFKLVIV